MPINEWRGDAPAIAQVTSLSCPDVSGAVEFYLGDRPLGWAREWRTAATSADADLYTPALAALWNRSRLGEFAEVSAAAGVVEGLDTLVLTARTPGRPFTVTTMIGGTSSANEAQIVTVLKATGGTTVLTFDGQSTTALAITSSAATVLAALEALSNIAPGDVTVELLAVGSWMISFAGAYAEANVPVITATSTSLTGGDCTVVVTPVVTGVLPVNAVQTVTLPGSPSGGTFILSLDGVATGAIAYNATAAAVQAALVAAYGAGTFTVSGGALPPTVTITAAGTNTGLPLPLFVGDGSLLTGGSTLLAVATTVVGVPGTNSSSYWTLATDPSIPDGNGKTGFRYRYHYLAPNGRYWQTAELRYTDSAATVQAALEDMAEELGARTSPPLFGAGNVTVTGSLNGSWTSGNLSVVFGGAWHSLPISLTLDQRWRTEYDYTLVNAPNCNRQNTALKTVVAAGAAGTSERQTITQTGSSALSFRAAFGGQISEPIPYGSTAPEISAILARMPSLGQMGYAALNPTAYLIAQDSTPLTGFATSVVNVQCLDGPLGSAPVTLVYYGGGLQSTNVAQITVLEAATAVDVAETVHGVPGTPEQQLVSLTGAPWGGTFPLTYSGQTTTGLSYVVSAAALQAALEALSNLAPGDVAVSGSGPWLVAFHADLGNVPLLSGVGSSLKNGSVEVVTQRDGGIQVTQSTSQHSRGPWMGDDPYNYSLGHLPQRGETLLFMFGDTGPRWGITWRAAFTRDAVDTSLLNCSGDFADGQVVEVRSTTTLPTGLSAATAYYVRDFDPDAGTLKLAATLGGAAIAISGGSGTHEVFVPLAGLKTRATWRGWIGNTVIDKTGKFRDYRPIYLKCGWQSGSRITVGEGQGSASPLVRLDTDDFPVLIEILNTSGSTESDLPSVLLICDHDETTLEVLDGDCGLALIAGETSQLKSLTIRDGEAFLGEGVTFAIGGYIDRTGGDLTSLATLHGILKLRG